MGAPGRPDRRAERLVVGRPSLAFAGVQGGRGGCPGAGPRSFDPPRNPAPLWCLAGIDVPNATPRQDLTERVGRGVGVRSGGCRAVPLPFGCSRCCETTAGLSQESQQRCKDAVRLSIAFNSPGSIRCSDTDERVTVLAEKQSLMLRRPAAGTKLNHALGKLCPVFSCSL